MDGKQRLVLDLRPGFHFAPTDAELILHYLRRKMDGLPPHLPIFNDVPIIDYRPDQITEEFRDSGEDRWYFFTKRTRKYATGTRPDRTTPGRGYWKATGPQKDIFVVAGGELVGRRRTLVFYTGPDDKTDWTMNKYENITSEEEANDKSVDKLGEWVLCTIQRQKSPRGGDEEKEGKAKAGGRKRKGKAQKGTDDQVLRIQGPEEAVLEMAWPEEGDEMDMFQLEQASSPNKRPHVMQQHDEPPPPCPETMMPAQDCDYGPGIVPPSLELPPQLSDSEMAASCPAVSCYGFDESMLLLLQFEMACPVLGAGYDDYGMTMYQPSTSHLDIAAAPLGAFSYGGSGAGHLNNDGYAGGHPGSLLGACNSTYTYQQQHSYAAGINKLATSSNSTYTYQQQQPCAARINKLATSSNSTYTHLQQHSHAAGTNKLAPSSSTYTYQQQHAHTAGNNKVDGTSNLATSNSTYTYQQQQSCAAGANKVALVRGPMSSSIGQGSNVQPQVEL